LHSISEAKILASLKPSDLVLDVGGWEKPFNRADYVIDLLPYETRHVPQSSISERFTKKSWICRDICDREPWPFKDKMFDFVVCSHVLEDVRDPLWVCHEIIRVGKAGYIETPSREYECVTGLERQLPWAKLYAGFHHHRWLVEVKNGELIFTQKTPLVSLPGLRIKEFHGESNICFFWKDEFKYRENHLLTYRDRVIDQLEFIKRKQIKSEDFKARLLIKAFLFLSKNGMIRRIYRVFHLYM